jgi:hypothetical protein
MTTKPAPVKKPPDEAVLIMLAELRGMIPTLIVCNLLAVIGCIIYGAVEAHDFRCYTGLAIGNAATVANFCHLGFKAANIARIKDAGRARIYATGSFLLRYFGAFAVFGALVHFGAMNVVTALIPLFFPKIHYTIKAVLNKKV